MDRIIIHNQCH